MKGFLLFVIFSITCCSSAVNNDMIFPAESFYELSEQDLRLFRDQQTSTTIRMRGIANPPVEILDIVYVPRDILSRTRNPTYSLVSSNDKHRSLQTEHKIFELQSLKPLTEYVICVNIPRTEHSACEIISTEMAQGMIENLLIVDKNQNQKHTTIEWSPPSGTADLNSNNEISYKVTTKKVAGNDTSLDESPITRTINVRSFSFEDFESGDWDICVSYERDYKSEPTCINTQGPFLRNIRDISDKEDVFELAWDTDESSSQSKRFTVEYDYSGVCHCGVKRTGGETVRNGIRYPLRDSRDPVLILIYDDTNKLVGKFFDNRFPRLTNGTVEVESEEDSLTFSWCIPNVNQVPANIELVISSPKNSRVEYKNFVGCRWKHRVVGLKSFTEYKWTLKMKRENANENVFRGETKTKKHTLCGGFENLEVIDNNRTEPNRITFEAKLINIIGNLATIKLVVENLENQENKTHEFKYTTRYLHEEHRSHSAIYNRVSGVFRSFNYMECEENYCKLNPFRSFTTEGNYRAYVSCQNKGSTKYSPIYMKIFTIDALVPRKASYGVDAKKKGTKSPDPWNKIDIIVNRGSLDKDAGNITKYYILHGKKGTLPDEEEGKEIDHPICNISHRNEGFHTMVVDRGAIADFPLKDLEYNEAYEVMFFYYNSKGCASSNKLRFFTPSNSGSPVWFFIVMFLLFLLLLFMAFHYSEKAKPHRLMPVNIPIELHHPKEQEFSYKIPKDKAVEIISRLLQGSCEDLQTQFKKLNELNFNNAITVANHPDNQIKNRYKDILPYDYSRVILYNTPGDETEYINASFIHGYKKPFCFIASQGPRTNTVVDFWRMIWENHVRIIVMATKFTEGVEKCSKYWPTKGEWPLQELTLKTLVESSEPEKCYTVRKFELKKNWTTRTVEHYHYTSWPDKGRPSNIHHLLKIMREIKLKTKSFKQQSPIVVHCSAGVDRTGAFIALYNLMDQFTDNSVLYVDPLATVFKLRMMRMLMVQNMLQYRFVYEGLLKIIQPYTPDEDPSDSKELLRAKEKFGFMNTQRISAEDSVLLEDEGLIPITDDEEEDENSKNDTSTDESKELPENMLRGGLNNPKPVTSELKIDNNEQMADNIKVKIENVNQNTDNSE